MAFKNFITKNSYTTIDEILYNKEAKSLIFDIKVFSDSTKTKLITKINQRISGREKCEVVEKYVTNYEDIPDNSSAFVISDTVINGKFKKRVLQRAGEPDFIEVQRLVQSDYIYLVDKKQYMHYDYQTGKYIIVDGHETDHFWNENLSVEKMKNYKDILEFCYVFAKRNLEIFQDVEEC